MHNFDCRNDVDAMATRTTGLAGAEADADAAGGAGADDDIDVRVVVDCRSLHNYSCSLIEANFYPHNNYCHCRG